MYYYIYQYFIICKTGKSNINILNTNINDVFEKNEYMHLNSNFNE